MVKQLMVIPLMRQFIQETKNGKRRKLNGERLLSKSISNYDWVLKQIVCYEEFSQKPICITINIRNNHRLILKEKNYWKKFYRNFSDYLLYEKGYYDNFVGMVFKVLKCFFRYLKSEKCLAVQECYEQFYVRREDIRVISLLPGQFCFLIIDKAFERTLSSSQKRCKDLFVFGCTAALRFSDLKSLKVSNVELRCNNYYLVFQSKKTDTAIQVKLPNFAVDIFKQYSRKKRPGSKLFPTISAGNFDKQLKALGEKAGWVEIIGKERTRNGVRQEIKKEGNKRFRFCDQMSSHLMRKTGITVLLMLGMQEYLVRKVSGHSSTSKEFFRYVNFAQSYITDEIDKAHQKLLSLYDI